MNPVRPSALALRAGAVCMLALAACRPSAESQRGGDIRPSPSDSAAGATLRAAVPFRGILTVSASGGQFHPCGTAASRPVGEHKRGALEPIARLAADAVDSVYVEFLGTAAGEADSVFVEELLRAAPLGESSGCRQPPQEAEAVARGNEPFWSVTVKQDQILFQEPENLDGLVFPAATPVDANGRRTYRSRREAGTPQTIEIVLERRGCSDSMSGEFMHLTAAVTLGARRLEGCAISTAAARGSGE